jgi:NAD+ synthase
VNVDLELDPEWTVRVLTGFLVTELDRTGHRRVVLGLSGGIDSALVAALASRALGPDAVVAISMPYRTSDPDSLADARQVVAMLGVEHEVVDITPAVDGFVQSAGALDRVRLGNVLARMRMIVLYDRSAARDALVLGTSNKTELMLGYGTLHGDMASALNPIGDLYKTQVRQLGRFVGLPARVLDKPPSADLWPDQTDEDELGFRYEDVDRLLSLLVDARVSPDRAIGRGFAPALVARVRTLVARSQFKRMPPVVAKVSWRSIGWDFRYPRDRAL